MDPEELEPSNIAGSSHVTSDASIVIFSVCLIAGMVESIVSHCISLNRAMVQVRGLVRM